MDKKYRKKLKTNFKYKIYYLEPNNRYIKAFNILYANFKLITGRNLSDKFVNFFNEFTFNYKNSINYKYKIKIYKKIMDKKY